MDIFKLVGSIFVDNTAANDSLSKTDQKAEGVGNKFSKVISTAAGMAVGVGVACAAGVAALAGVATKAAQTTDNIDKMSQKIGISRTAYQELDFICSQNGMTVDQLQGNMKKMVNVMDDAVQGSASAQEKLDRLGVSAVDLNGNLKTSENMFFETIGALQEMEDVTKRNALANDIFGGSYTEMLPLLNSGADSMEELRAQAHELGLVLSDDAVDAGVVFTDTIDKIKRTFDSIVTQIGVSVMPIFQQAADWFLENMPLIQAICQTAFGIIEAVVVTAGNIIGGIFNSITQSASNTGLTFNDVFAAIELVVTSTLQVLKEGWELLGKPIFDFMGIALETVAGYFAEKMPEIQAFVADVFNDIGIMWEENLKPCFEAIGNFITNVLAPAFQFVFNNIITAYLNTFLKCVQDLWNNALKPIFTGITDFLTGVFTGNWRLAFEGIASIVEGIFGGLVAIVKIPLNNMIGLINNFLRGLNNIKIPEWVPLVGGRGFNIDPIPLLAKGGTVYQSGHVIVGEAGPEMLDLPTGAKVTPIANNKTSNDGQSNEQLINEIRALQELLKQFIETVLGLTITVDDREFARLVKANA